ncbi:MAG TPA: phosphotransferase, partial [Chloroflexota bacterium]|nr:phosphotransferase [Chloroflexota bacterium]
MLQEKAASYRRRIAARFPELAGAPSRLVVEDGQYNDILVVAERIVFRFPRFQEGVDRLPALAHLLRVVRRHVTLPVPDPLYTALDRTVVGEAFIGYPMLPGEPLWQEHLATITDEGVRHRLGTQLAAFLRELHAVPLEEVVPGGAATFDPLAAWADLYARVRTKLF